jgi:hypothetical protein
LNGALFKWSDLYYGLTGHFAPRKLMQFLPTLLYNVWKSIEFD